jgi:hypothetical protein
LWQVEDRRKYQRRGYACGAQARDYAVEPHAGPGVAQMAAGEHPDGDIEARVHRQVEGVGGGVTLPPASALVPSMKNE